MFWLHWSILYSELDAFSHFQTARKRAHAWIVANITKQEAGGARHEKWSMLLPPVGYILFGLRLIWFLAREHRARTAEYSKSNGAQENPGE